MRAVDLIAKKRNGQELSEEEIGYLVTGYTKELIPDYQMAAFLMAVYFNKMSAAETSALTLAMADSGERIDLTGIPGIKVDKHSTGGVADTTTLVVLPLVAAAGATVAKMSGRGLGFTGGTVDKLEAIPGFEATLSRETFIRQLKTHKMAITGQSKGLAPADGKLYALRDVTATVESIPLIASSIMSKKIAAGADKILLDVKVGSGAFMDSLDKAVELAETMVKIGNSVGRETRAILTGMDEPLGYAVGNGLEVKEAIEILSGQGSRSLREVCLTLGAHLLQLSEVEKDLDKAYQKLEELLISGAGLAKLQELIEVQGGNPAVVHDFSLLGQAKYSRPAECKSTGYVQSMKVAQIGLAAAVLGAGRMVKGQSIDLSVGIVMKCRIGDLLREGDEIAVIEGNDKAKMEEAKKLVLAAVEVADQEIKRPPVIFGTVDQSGFHPIE